MISMFQCLLDGVCKIWEKALEAQTDPDHMFRDLWGDRKW